MEVPHEGVQWHKDPSGAPKSLGSGHVSRYLVGGAVGTEQHPVPLTLVPDPVAFVLVAVPGDTDTGAVLRLRRARWRR